MPKKRQAFRRSKQATVPSMELSGLAPRKRLRLFRGLERFANTGDDLSEYEALSKGWPSFWPLDLQGGKKVHPLSWADECHPLFLVYRDTLRRLWVSNPEAVSFGHVGFLLGISIDLEFVQRREMPTVTGLWEAWESVNAESPNAFVADRPDIFPYWKTGNFAYDPLNDFQRAVFLLFRESWRAKTCPKCSTYFVARKPAQLYCSVECSNASHKANALRWWNEKGAKRRATQVKKRDIRNRTNAGGRKN